MSPLILTVLNKDLCSAPIRIPTKDYQYKGEHPKV